MQPSQNNSFPVDPAGNTQPSSTPMPQAPTPPSPPMGGMVTPSSFSQSQPKNNKKMPLIIGGIAGFLLLIGLGSYFFLYVPNTPSNVWAAGLSRSGKALGKITETATDKESLDKILKTQVEATVDGDIGGMTFNGSLDTKFDDSNTDSEIKFKTNAGGKNVDLGLKLLANIPKDKKFPNVYFQFYGLKALGLDKESPEFAKVVGYENKWIALESEYIEKNFPQSADLPETSKEQLTAKDAADLAKAFNEVNTEYIFTSDKSKAVLEQKQFIAKEEVDGIKAYHYIVGINTNNAKSYCKAIVNKMTAQSAIKKLLGEGESIDQIKQDGIKSCDEIKETKETFDMWMDAKYKLIYKARFTNKENKKSYVDIGQNYKGGDDINFFVNANDEDSKTTVKFTMSTNIKTNVSSGNLTIASSDANSPGSIKVTIKATPFDGTINTDKPAGSVSIEEFLKAIGIDDPTMFVPTSSSSFEDDSSLQVQGAKTNKSNSSEKNFDGFVSAIKELFQ